MNLSRIAAAAVCVALLANTARADEAVDWKARGDSAMEAGRAAEALEAYDRAAKLSPQPALDYNRGRAMLALGDFAGALDAFEAFTKNASPELREKTSRLPEVMAELSGKVAYIVITCARCTNSSELRVRGRRIVVGEEIRANPGAAELTVATHGYLPFRRSLDLSASHHTTFEAALETEPTTGRLALRVAPSKALVSVDGGRRTSLPHALELLPGVHELRLEADGYEPKTVSVSIERGKERSLDVRLPEKGPALYARPWFWVVVGVAAATATSVAIVAATQPRGLDTGSLGTYRLP